MLGGRVLIVELRKINTSILFESVIIQFDRSLERLLGVTWLRPKKLRENEKKKTSWDLFSVSVA